MLAPCARWHRSPGRGRARVTPGRASSALPSGSAFPSAVVRKTTLTREAGQARRLPLAALGPRAAARGRPDTPRARARETVERRSTGSEYDAAALSGVPGRVPFRSAPPRPGAGRVPAIPRLLGAVPPRFPSFPIDVPSRRPRPPPAVARGPVGRTGSGTARAPNSAVRC